MNILFLIVYTMGLFDDLLKQDRATANTTSTPIGGSTGDDGTTPVQTDPLAPAQIITSAETPIVTSNETPLAVAPETPIVITETIDKTVTPAGVAETPTVETPVSEVVSAPAVETPVSEAAWTDASIDLFAMSGTTTIGNNEPIVTETSPAIETIEMTSEEADVLDTESFVQNSLKQIDAMIAGFEKQKQVFFDEEAGYEAEEKSYAAKKVEAHEKAMALNPEHDRAEAMRTYLLSQLSGTTDTTKTEESNTASASVNTGLTSIAVQWGVTDTITPETPPVETKTSITTPAENSSLV